MLRKFASLCLAFAFFQGSATACGVSARGPVWDGITLASLVADEAIGVQLTALGHASFLIETPGHISIVTDYNGFNVPRDPPTIATMNHAHPTHYTMHPDPRIPYVLHGWMDDGKPPQIDLTVGDVRVRNVATNIRDWSGGTEYYGNSIFVFETAGLCIAHLSHLHHLLTDDDVVALGPLDVVMMPADGVWTMDHGDVVRVMDKLHASINIPFHYYGDPEVLSRFLMATDARYPIVRANAASISLSRQMLPMIPEILVLDMPRG